jgi:hypothetical protein
VSQACSGTAPIGTAGWLSLAAAPTFAIMALMTAVLGGGASEALCSSASPLSGMIPMYLLMSAFHAAPWLKLIANRRSGVGRS